MITVLAKERNVPKLSILWTVLGLLKRLFAENTHQLSRSNVRMVYSTVCMSIVRNWKEFVFFLLSIEFTNPEDRSCITSTWVYLQKTSLKKTVALCASLQITCKNLVKIGWIVVSQNEGF